jgi:hypothetical protein
MTNPWDQQSKESSKAFAAFIAYRDMGSSRSLRQVAQSLGKAANSIAELSKRHNWQERVMAWDAHVDRESQANQIEAVKDMKARQINLALKAQKAASMGIKKLLQHLSVENKQKGLHSSSISPYVMKPDSLSKLLETGCRLERLNRDEPEQNMELMHSQGFEKLSEEELASYNQLLLKMSSKHE